jgi:hypothetical protein
MFSSLLCKQGVAGSIAAASTIKLVNVYADTQRSAIRGVVPKIVRKIEPALAEVSALSFCGRPSKRLAVCQGGYRTEAEQTMVGGHQG